MNSTVISTEILTAGYSYHFTPFHITQHEGFKHYLFRLQTEGYAYAMVDQQLKLISPGDLVIYTPNDAYELNIQPSSNPKETRNEPQGSGDYYVFCKGSWLDNWWRERSRPRHINISLDEGVLSIWQQIIGEKRRVWDELIEVNDYLLRCLCLELDRAITNRNQAPKGSSAYAYRIKYFVERNATTQFTLEEVARYVGLSVSRVVHLFKNTFGQSIMDYVITIRLSIACERIRFTTMSLEQIADSSGFRSYSHFSRLFHSHYKMSPRQYRLHHP